MDLAGGHRPKRWLVDLSSQPLGHGVRLCISHPATQVPSGPSRFRTTKTPFLSKATWQSYLSGPLKMTLSHPTGMILCKWEWRIKILKPPHTVCICMYYSLVYVFQNLSVLQLISPTSCPFYYPTFSNHAPLIPKRPWVLPLGKTWCLCTMPWARVPWPWPWWRAPVGCAAAAAWAAPWAPWAGWVRCGRSCDQLIPMGILMTWLL